MRKRAEQAQAQGRHGFAAMLYHRAEMTHSVIEWERQREGRAAAERLAEDGVGREPVIFDV
jgi:hypothetical protein